MEGCTRKKDTCIGRDVIGKEEWKTRFKQLVSFYLSGYILYIYIYICISFIM